MDTATRAALDLVEEFSLVEEVRESVRLCLSEAPIGDEYQLCNDTDWDRFNEFAKFADARGVDLWEPIPYDAGPQVEYKSALKAGTDASERNALRRQRRNQSKDN